MSGGVVAAVKVGPGRTELRTLGEPEVAPDGGLLRIEAAGICGSDVRSYPRPLREGGPHVMGHENVGTIVALGRQAAAKWDLREGDRVVLEEYLPCGECAVCRTGEYRFCEQTNIHRGGIVARYGATPLSVPPGLWGGFSELLYLHPCTVAHRMPEKVPAEVAALVLPLANGWQWAVLDGGAGPGRSVLVIGPGQQGLGCVLAAKEAGASLVIVAGRAADRGRLEVARALGADATVDVDDEGARERISSLSGGGVDLAIDTAAASDASVSLALDALKDKGGVALVAAGGMDQTLGSFPIGVVKRKYAAIRGARGHSNAAVRRAVEIVSSDRYPLRLAATHRFGLTAVDAALRTAAAGGDAIHVSVVPR